MTAILLSGALGALLATVANAVFQLWKEQVRLKADVLLAFVAWYEQCHNLINRAIHYQQLKGDLSLTPNERARFGLQFMETGFALANLVHSHEQPAKVALVWGQHEEVKLVESIAEHFGECVDQILAKPGAKPGADAKAQIAKITNEKLAPIYKKLVGKMLHQASVRMIMDKAWHGK